MDRRDFVPHVMRFPWTTVGVHKPAEDWRRLPNGEFERNQPDERITIMSDTDHTPLMIDRESAIAICNSLNRHAWRDSRTVVYFAAPVPGWRTWP